MTESCCAAAGPQGETKTCPRCGTRGQRVDWLTVAAMLVGEVPLKQEYWVCRRPDCEAVYYGRDAKVLTAAEMNVAPGFKSGSPDALVCYCFQYRRRDIEAELAAEGRTSIPDRIAAEIKADNCACEVRNPSGKCCLGDVNEIIRGCLSPPAG